MTPSEQNDLHPFIMVIVGAGRVCALGCVPSRTEVRPEHSRIKEKQEASRGLRARTRASAVAFHASLVADGHRGTAWRRLGETQGCDGPQRSRPWLEAGRKETHLRRRVNLGPRLRRPLPTQVLIHTGRNRPNAVWSHNGIVRSHEKDRGADTRCRVDGPWAHSERRGRARPRAALFHWYEWCRAAKPLQADSG